MDYSTLDGIGSGSEWYLLILPLCAAAVTILLAIVLFKFRRRMNCPKGICILLVVIAAIFTGCFSLVSATIYILSDHIADEMRIPGEPEAILRGIETQFDLQGQHNTKLIASVRRSEGIDGTLWRVFQTDPSAVDAVVTAARKQGYEEHSTSQWIAWDSLPTILRSWTESSGFKADTILNRKSSSEWVTIFIDSKRGLVLIEYLGI